jgi:hypothetical protein
MTQDPTPQEALSAIQTSRATLGERIRPLLGEEIALAIATGGILAAFAVAPPWGSLLMIPFILASTWLTVCARNRMGLFLNRAVCAPARRIGLIFGLGLAALVLIVLLSSLLLDLRWPALVCGGLAALLTFYGRRAWLRAIVDDLSGSAR